jgi:N-acetylmuramoyl-L-alanine amidase CwlA
MKRTSKQQGIHDSTVRKIANQLNNNGWKVHADIPGYQEPHSIGKKNRIPDIEAVKGGRRKIIEVETPLSLAKDRDQQSTFRRHAGHKPNTTFEIKVTK